MAKSTTTISVSIPRKLNDLIDSLVAEHNLHSAPEDKATKSQFVTEAICYFLDSCMESVRNKKSNDNKEA